MDGFVVRFKAHEEYINTLESLKKEGYLGKDISVGTSMSDTVGIEDSFRMQELEKRFHYVHKFLQKRKKVKGGKYIIINPNYVDEEVSGISIGIDNRPHVKKEFYNLLGKDNVMVSLHTVYDDREGDVYDFMVEPDDVLSVIKKLV